MGFTPDLFFENLPATNTCNQRAGTNLTLLSGTKTGGISDLTGAGNPTSVVTPTEIGDWYTDTTNGFIWLSTGTTNTSWVCINNGSPIVQTAFVTVPLASIVAGNVTIVPAISGHTITPIYWKVIIAGTLGGSGTFTLQDTNSSPVNIMSATYGAQGNFLAMGSGLTSYNSDGATLSGVTYGAGMAAALTASKGIVAAQMSSLTTITGYIVIVSYIVK